MPRPWSLPFVHTVVSIALLSGLAMWTLPAAAQTATPRSNGEMTYESPSFGYEVSWDVSWTAGDLTDSSQDGADTLELTTEDATLTVVGIAAEPNGTRPSITTALLDAIRSITQVDPDWTIVASAPAGPAPSLVVAYEDGGETVRAYIEAREVAGGDAVATVSLVAARDEFDAALADAQASVTLDDAPIFAGALGNGTETTGEAATPEATGTPEAEATATEIPTATPRATERATEEDDATAQATERDATATPTETPEATETPTEEPATPEPTGTEAANEGPPHGRTDTPEATGAEGSGIEGNTYTSPQYGFTLTWDEDEWEVSSSSSDEETGYDSIRFSGERSFIEIRSDPDYRGDPVSCRDDWADILRAAEGVEEFRPLEDARGDHITEEDEDIASAAFEVTLTTETGDTFDVVDYVECRVLVPGESNLVIIHSTLLEDYDDQVEAREDLLAGLDLATDGTAETPAADATATARETPDGRGDAADYTSPTFGYTLSWDEPWTIERETSEGGFDTLELTNGVSRVFFEGQEGFEGNPEQCLNDAVTEARTGEGISDFEPMREDDGRRVAGFQSGRAFAAYTLTYSNPGGGGPERYVEYLECRTLAEGESVLEITQIVPAADYEAEAAAFEDLLANLELAEA